MTAATLSADTADFAGLIRPIRPESRDMRVLAGLAEVVVQSGMRPGDRFPAERVMAERLGVGRSTVREALKRWEALGIVARRKGSGTFLRTPITPGALHMPLTVQLESESLRRMIEVRRALEFEVVPLACARGRDEDLARIGDAYHALAASHARYGPSPQLDRTFHRAIYTAAHNPLFGQIIEQMQEAFDALFAAPFGDRGFGDDSFAMHGELCEAVLARDAARAHAAIAGILDVLLRELDGIEVA